MLAHQNIQFTKTSSNLHASIKLQTWKKDINSAKPPNHLLTPIPAASHSFQLSFEGLDRRMSALQVLVETVTFRNKLGG